MNDINNNNRQLNVEGTYNFRDIGGYKTNAFEQTKWKTLFRSDAFHNLTDKGAQDFHVLNIKEIVDLRDNHERSRFPNKVPNGVNLNSHPIFPSALSHVDRNLNIQSLTDLIFFEHADAVASAVKFLSQIKTPVVIHCTAGKDRTGAVIAATLSVIGVDRDQILEDYELSEKNLSGLWLEKNIAGLKKINRPITEDIISLIASSPLPVMEKTLKTIDQKYGSVTDYLIKNGLTETNISDLHKNLIG